VEVLRSGPLSTLQDLGRPGFAHLGVPRSGALDQSSFAAANALVGNHPQAAVVETTLGGITLRVLDTAIMAVTGADCDVHVGGVPAPLGTPIRLAAGQVLDVGPAHSGLRSYVAIRGGFDAPQELGSRSTDALSGIGPSPLSDGDYVPVGSWSGLPEPQFGQRLRSREPNRRASSDSTPADSTPADSTAADSTPLLVLHATLGPRADAFTQQAIARFTCDSWTVTADSNRIGARLAGAALEHAAQTELPSEGMVVGAVQVPPSGQPIIFLADHPTTGGYPVIAVVDRAALDALAQAAAGTKVQFEVTGR
jgi:biotin-dependent carboxylase-like uncharacterized protein